MCALRPCTEIGFMFKLLSTVRTPFLIAAVHIELAPCRREAMPISGRRQGPKGEAEEVEPGHGGRNVDMEIVHTACCDGAVINDT
jgi:hypothetical protein